MSNVHAVCFDVIRKLVELCTVHHYIRTFILMAVGLVSTICFSSSGLPEQLQPRNSHTLLGKENVTVSVTACLRCIRFVESSYFNKTLPLLTKKASFHTLILVFHKVV